VRDYLKSWAGPSHPVIKILAYETLPTILPRGTYIFSDLERLSSAQVTLAGEVWNQLGAAGDGIRLLNHPVKAARRLTLLERLCEAGRNTFRAYRATDRKVDPRFPVFVRRARGTPRVRMPTRARSLVPRFRSRISWAMRVRARNIRSASITSGMDAPLRGLAGPQLKSRQG
jgi:hypothetical protein